MPPNFVAKTANGYGNLVQNVLRSARRYASDIMENKNSLSRATQSAEDFWFLYEVPLMEGEAGGMMAFIHCALSVVARLDQNGFIANICYGTALGLTFVVFIFFFGGLRRSLLAEAKFARGVLGMVPHDFLRDSKSMIEYIETLSAQLEA